MITWEYLTQGVPTDNMEVLLNLRGTEGWELVAVVPGEPGNLVFKRESGTSHGGPSTVSTLEEIADAMLVIRAHVAASDLSSVVHARSTELHNVLHEILDAVRRRMK